MNFLNDIHAIAEYMKRIYIKYPIETNVLKWRSFSPGECIFEQGFPIPFLSFLVKGKVKVYTTSEEGRRLIVTFNNPLELFGDVELIQQVDTLHTYGCIIVGISTLLERKCKF